MTEQEFKAELKKLNKKLMSAKTRGEHSEADHDINILVDLYRSPVDNTDINEGNAKALLIAG